MIDCAFAADRQIDMFPVDAGVLVPTDGSADQCDPAVRERLDDILRRVRVAQKKHIQSGLEIGRLLLAAKRSLKHGLFMRWVTADVGISPSTAANYMNAAMLVDEFPKFGILPPSSLYTLAKAPRPVIEAVAAEVEAGARPTHRDVMDRCKAARGSTEPTTSGAPDVEAAPKLAATGRSAILEVLERLVAHTGDEERSLLRALLQEMEPEEVKAAILAALDRPAKSIAEAGGKADQGAETPAIETSSPDNHPDEFAEENDEGDSPGCSSPTAR